MNLLDLLNQLNLLLNLLLMNKLFNSVLRDSLILSPFASFKCADPWNVAIDAAGGLLGFINNERNNSNNMQIARESNAQQYKMFKEQMDYQTGMWNKANEYNDPRNQSKRLAAAGINPAAVLGNGSAVTDVSSPSVPSAPQMHSPSMQAYDVGASVSRVVNDYLNAKSVNAQTRLIDEQAAQAAFENEHSYQRFSMEMQDKALSIQQKIEDLQHSKKLHPKQVDLLDKQIDNEYQRYDMTMQQLFEMRDTYLDRKKSLTLGNELSSQQIESQKAQRMLWSSEATRNFAEAGLSNAQTNQIRRMLPFNLGLAALSFNNANLDWENRKAYGYINESEAVDIAKKIAETAHLNQMTDFEKQNFHSVWMRYILPCLGPAGNIATAAVFKAGN